MSAETVIRTATRLICFPRRRRPGCGVGGWVEKDGDGSEGKSNEEVVRPSRMQAA